MRVVTTYNAGPFAAGAALAAFDRIGVCHIPFGTGNTERVCKPSNGCESTPPCSRRPTPPTSSSGVPSAASTSPARASSACWSRASRAAASRRFRAALEQGWGARVTEAMGIGDIGVSLWGECEHQDGMHLGAYGFVHPELIDPATEQAIALEDGATGELVLTHLRHRAAPLLRFRTRDHVLVRTSPCPCGRSGPRVRCIGRTDDMLIVRGVNVFPSAVREVVGGFTPSVSGNIVVRPPAPGVKQEPPLPVAVELAHGVEHDPALADAIRTRLRDVLVVQTSVDLLPFGTLPRSEYKSRLVQHEEA